MAWSPLVAALAAAALPVVVVNPRQVRDFAKATGTLAKTDTLDAGVLAHFADAVRPEVRPLKDAETQVLNSLTARRHQVMTMLVSEKNRLGTAVGAVSPRIEAHIAWLEQELSDSRGYVRLCAGVQCGVKRTTCSARFPASESRSLALPPVTPEVGLQAVGHRQATTYRLCQRCVGRSVPLGGRIVYHRCPVWHVEWGLFGSERGQCRCKLSVVRFGWWRRCGILPAALEPVALAVHLQDVDVVGEPAARR